MTPNSIKENRDKWSNLWRRSVFGNVKDPFTLILTCSRFIFSVIRSYLIRGHLQSSKNRVLEVGCGTAWSSILLGRKKKLKIIGVDISKAALCMAKENSRRFGVEGFFILGDANYLPFKDNSFNLVWSLGVLEHFEDPFFVVSEMSRVIKYGAPIIALVPADHNILVSLRDFAQKFTGFFFDFNSFWGGAPAYHVDIEGAFRKVSLNAVTTNLIPLELFIEDMIIGWKKCCV